MLGCIESLRMSYKKTSLKILNHIFRLFQCKEAQKLQYIPFGMVIADKYGWHKVYTWMYENDKN